MGTCPWRPPFFGRSSVLKQVLRCTPYIVIDVHLDGTATLQTQDGQVYHVPPYQMRGGSACGGANG